jgi:adenylate cyclase
LLSRCIRSLFQCKKDDRIYGDGVNLAARIESLADPGGICVSRGVHDQIRKNISHAFEYMGAHSVKNISEPVRVYRIVLSSGPKKPAKRGPIINMDKIKRPYTWLIALLVAALAGGGIYTWYLHRQSPTSVWGNALRLPEKPAIAVLPFANRSRDPEQDYFSDGVTNDIISALSRFRELLVIANNTVFTYKGKAVNIEQIGQELQVTYIVEGSVQKIADKIRINAQLIDAATGFHI